MRIGSLAPRVVTCVQLAAAAALAVASALTSAAGLGGTVTGDVAQEGSRDSYPVEMELYGSVGNVDYPSLRCGGTVRFLREDNGAFVYRERITYGKAYCHEDGTIQISPKAGAATVWSWKWEGHGVPIGGVVHGPAVKNES